MAKKTKQDSPLDRRVGIYNQGTNGGYFLKDTSTLRDILTKVSSSRVKRIKEYRKTKDKEIKAALPAYTPAGYYADVRSLKVKPTEKTNQVQLDFDNDKEGLEQIFNECKFITAAGTSCGGKGMFFLINTEGKDYSGYFHALADYFKEHYNKQVDLAVSSKNELRFISLPEETFTREDPTLWKLIAEPPEQIFVREKLPLLQPGEVIKVPKDKVGKLHYHDLSSYAGLSNAQGVPVEAAAEYISTVAFSKKSHLHGKPDKIKEIVYKHYNVYEEQHGESSARIEVMKREQVAGTVDMPELTFRKESSNDMKALQVIRAVLSKYSIVVDKFKVSYKYNGTFWEEISESQLDHFLVACAEAAGYPPAKAGTLTFRKNMLELMHKEAGINELATDHTAFNLANGIVVFKSDHTIEFLEHDKSRYFNYQLKYNYDPKAKCPKFDTFINRIMPNKENQQLFFQYVASVFDFRRVEKMLFLLGSGANGKSTLFEVILSLFGNASTTTNLNRLTTPDRSERAAYQIYNKLIAISHDDKGPNDAELFKTLASRDPIAMRSLYKDEIQSSTYARLIIGMNSSPNIEATHGAQRRIIMIPMNVRIAAEEQNLNLKNELQDELSGIFNKVISAHIAGKGIVQSEESKKATEELILSNDIVAQFVDSYINCPIKKEHVDLPNMLKKYPDVEIEKDVLTVTTVYKAFATFCEDEEGIQPNRIMRRKNFKARLINIWYEPKFIKETLTGNSICGWWYYKKKPNND